MKRGLKKAAPADSTAAVLKAILLYLFVVFAGAAILAPYLYSAVRALAAHFEWFASLTRHPFHRYVSRCLIVIALLGLWPFVQSLGIRSWRELGLRFGRRHWGEWMEGFAWGFGALALAALAAAGFGARTLDLDHTGAEWIKHLRNAALAALLVGFLEELLFRGAMFGSLRRVGAFWSAALLSSMLYALLHFFERPESPSRIEWNSGLLVLSQMLAGFTNWQMLVPGFINLTLVGIMLALALERTRSLLFSFGLHAGFIFWVKSYGFVTRETAGADAWVWGTRKLYDGWVTGLILFLVLVVLWKTLPRAENQAVQPAQEPGNPA